MRYNHFSKYITNENLLKYSNKKVLEEGRNLDINEISIGLGKSQLHNLNNEEGFYYLLYSIVVKQGENSGFSEGVIVLIKNVNGRLVIADWYIPHGTVSYFDDKVRPTATMNSPEIWDNQEFVNKIFEKAGITR